MQTPPYVAKIATALFQILTPNGRTGAGFIINPKGLAVTSAHVVEDNESITACAPNRATCIAPVLLTDQRRDLAALRVLMPAGSDYLRLADSDRAPTGIPVLAAGYPPTLGQHAGQDYTLTAGIISGKRNSQGVRYIQTDAAINHGNSGGPLIDQEGSVVGLNASHNPDGANLGFAIASNEIKDWLNRHLPELQSDRRQPYATSPPNILPAETAASGWLKQITSVPLPRIRAQWHK